MPQTQGGVEALKNFLKEYGKKGKKYFFGHVMNDKKFAKAAGEMSVYNRGHKK